MSSFEIEGKLILKEDAVQISDSFKKREFVLYVENERNSDWSDSIKFQLAQDKCALVDNCNVGEVIKVGFNVRGRKWEKDGKVNYFNSLDAWRIEKVGSGNAPSNEGGNNLPPQDGDDTDNLPF